MISAIERSDLACVEAEISCDADPTFGVDAAISKLEPKALRLLLHKGAVLRYMEFGKRQASLLEAITADACLMMVAEEGFTSAVGSILRLRSSANTIEGRDGKIFPTNLIRLERTPVLKMLLNKGVFCRDFVADSSVWSLPVAAKSSMDVYTLLQNFGACFSTALFAAFFAKHSTNLESLLLMGMLERKLGNGIDCVPVAMTPSILAVCRGASEIAVMLVKYGANPEIHPERDDILYLAKAIGPGYRDSFLLLQDWFSRCSGFGAKVSLLERYLFQDGSVTVNSRTGVRHHLNYFISLFAL